MQITTKLLTIQYTNKILPQFNIIVCQIDIVIWQVDIVMWQVELTSDKSSL